MKKSNWIFVFVSVVALGLLGMATYNGNQKNPKIEIAPEISLKSPQGITYNLSALKGNYVLVEFWASWCRPCRIVNAQIVPEYRTLVDRQYANNAKLILYHVSLDKDTVAWRKAITNDRMFWPHQVVDPYGWESEVAQEWKVTSIPSNFLVNPKGVILYKNVKITEVDSLIRQQEK